MPVLPHPPAQQRPVVDGHQRGLVRPILHQQPRRAGGVIPGRTIQNSAVVRTEPTEHRCIVGPHCDRHRIELQHLDTRDQPPQVCAGDRAARPWLAKSLGRNGYPPGLRGGQPNGPDRHGAENTASSTGADFLVRLLGVRFLRILEFLVCRLKGGRNPFQVPVYAH